MKFETLELELTDDEKLSLICLTFGISNELLEDIKTQHTDIAQRVLHLVLSEAVSRLIQEQIKIEEDKNAPEA